MRIIAGKAGRTTIKVPPSVARPTTDFVRQAVFSILGDLVINSRVLDLFCGSGALGLEALSRGASSCTFIDENRQASSTTQNNLIKSKLIGGLVIKSDVFSFLKRDTSSYDIILADPPYCKNHGDVDLAAKLLSTPEITNRLNHSGYLIVEISSSQPTPYSPSLQLLDRREYGSSAIAIFAHTAA